MSIDLYLSIILICRSVCHFLKKKVGHVLLITDLRKQTEYQKEIMKELVTSGF